MRRYDIEDIEEILEDYSIEEILEENDLTVAEALELLWSEGYITLPETLPVTTKKFSQDGEDD